MSKQFCYTIETLLHKLAVIHNFEDCHDFTLKMENNIHKAIKSYIEFYDIQISPLKLVFTDEDTLRHKKRNVCNNKKNINDNEILEFVNGKISFIRKTIKRLSKVNNDDNKYKQTESVLNKLQIEISEYIKKEISTNVKENNDDNNKEKIEIQLLPSNINFSFFDDCFTNSNNNNNHFNKNDLNKFKFKSSLFQE